MQMRSTWGIQRTNRELTEGMSNSLSCRLRWGGRPADYATLAILLLKVSESIISASNGREAS